MITTIIHYHQHNFLFSITFNYLSAIWDSRITIINCQISYHCLKTTITIRLFTIIHHHHHHHPHHPHHPHPLDCLVTTWLLVQYHNHVYLSPINITNSYLKLPSLDWTKLSLDYHHWITIVGLTAGTIIGNLINSLEILIAGDDSIFPNENKD